MIRARSFLLATLSLTVALAACDDDPVGIDEEEPPADECSTELTTDDDGTFVELCELSEPVGHVVIEDLHAPATHASTQIWFGADVAPDGPSAETGAGQFQLLFYGGGAPFPPAIAQASFAGSGETLEGDASFINDGATVCFDLHEGGNDGAPEFILWVDGMNGADCFDRSSLTATSAFGGRSLWQGVTGAIDKSTPTWLRFVDSAQPPTVTLYSDAVLEPSEIDAAVACTTTWQENSDWQELCAPELGGARHIRMEDVESSSSNSYFYAIIGEDPAPSGNPAPSDGKLILTGGTSFSGSSWTWFRFDDGSTTQYTYETDAGAAIYTEGPTTICFDLGENDEGNARAVFWATGANGADCDDLSSLTLDNSLYDSTTDAETADIWDVPLITDALNFVKTNNTNAGMGDVVVYSEAAVL